MQAVTKKISGIKDSEVRYMVPISNHDSAGRWKDLNQGRFRKRALFKQSRRLLRLKADTSRIEACWYCTNNIKYATLFYQDNHSTTIHSGPVFKGRIFVYLLMQGDRFAIDECVNQWSFGQRILVWCDRRQNLGIAKFLPIFGSRKIGKYLNSL